MIALCAMLAVARSAHVRCDTQVVVEKFNGPVRYSCPQDFANKRVGHRIIMGFDCDMIIKASTTFFPLGIDIRMPRQWA